MKEGEFCEFQNIHISCFSIRDYRQIRGRKKDLTCQLVPVSWTSLHHAVLLKGFYALKMYDIKTIAAGVVLPIIAFKFASSF